MSHEPRGVPWLLWPFVAIWRLVTFVLVGAGRLVCALLGLVCMFLGVVLTLSIAGAPFGIPLAFVGGLLLVRAIF